MVEVSREGFPKVKIERKTGADGNRKIQEIIFCGSGTLRIANQVGVNFVGAVPAEEQGVKGYRVTMGKEELFIPASLCVVRFKYEK